MSRLTCSISVSLDGYVTGPNPGPEQGLGEGGEQLHEWVVKLASWREMHGHQGGERNVDSDLFAEDFARIGAIVIGKRMFGGGDGPWGDDPTIGVWGEQPPFAMPVFVLTHHPRETITVGQTTFAFVSDGIDSALEQARAGAGGDKDVSVGGGANVIQQYLAAGLLDELQLTVVPVLLGGGVRLLEGLGDAPPKLELTRVVESPSGVAHLRYAVG
jgi:dihydrofolate reductase